VCFEYEILHITVTKLTIFFEGSTIAFVYHISAMDFEYTVANISRLHRCITAVTWLANFQLLNPI